MTIRPPFAEIKSYQEFSKYYWYRDELVQICRNLGIDSSGMKAELCHNIEEYFNGTRVLPQKTRHKTKATVTELLLSTKLVECGFSFGPRFREFFAKQTGIQNFKFNVDMVATVKKVKADNDADFTLGDLLDIYYGRKTYAKYDNSSLQWNRFVKDFCADPQTSHFSNKLKIAALLWREVRNSTREKVYTPDLLTEFAERIDI
jgi:hypothetical protein